MELWELTDVNVILNLPGGLSSNAVHLPKGGIQGGVRTPGQFNAIIECALYEPVRIWQEKGWGILPDHNFLLTHLVWCDNIFLLESDVKRAGLMMIMMTDSLSRFGAFWKPSSLEVTVAGS